MWGYVKLGLLVLIGVVYWWYVSSVRFSFYDWQFPFFIFLCIMVISTCALFGEYHPGGNSSNKNNPPNNVYTPEFHMPPQEDYDPNWDPYYKWMPENKYHDQWVEENQHNHSFDNSDYVDDHYYYDDDG